MGIKRVAPRSQRHIRYLKGSRYNASSKSKALDVGWRKGETDEKTDAPDVRFMTNNSEKRSTSGRARSGGSKNSLTATWIALNNAATKSGYDSGKKLRFR